MLWFKSTIEGGFMDNFDFDNMSLADLKKEVVQAREKNKTILSDLNNLVGLIDQIKLKYHADLGVSSEEEKDDLQPEKINLRKEVVKMVKEQSGLLTSDEIIQNLFNKNLVKDLEKAKINMPSTISRLNNHGFIKQETKGKPWKWVKDYD